MERERPSDDPRQASTTAPPPGAPKSEAEPRIAREYRTLGKPVRLVSTAEALLRVPGRILFEMRNGNARPLAGTLLALAAACFLAYGLTVGTFSGGDQLWAAPLKIAGGAALCALICFPSLVVFTLLSGSETSIGEIFVLLAGALALAGLLLVGLGPVSWVFAQSTDSAAFMGALHLLFWAIALKCGIRFLGAATGFLHGGSGRHLFVWSAVFLVVSLQMMTTLRPIVGSGERLLQPGKKFFLTHWAETLDEAPPRSGR